MAVAENNVGRNGATSSDRRRQKIDSPVGKKNPAAEKQQEPKQTNCKSGQD